MGRPRGDGGLALQKLGAGGETDVAKTGADKMRPACPSEDGGSGSC